MSNKAEVATLSKGVYIEPKYVGEFKCVGSVCKDTCCAGWNVIVDKKTFKKYRRSNSATLSVLYKEKIAKVRSVDRSEANFATIVLDSTGSCPFLDQTKLCKIQAEEGESMLSHTCSTYPRIDSTIKSVRQRYLTPSCPEVARLISIDPSALELSVSSTHPHNHVTQANERANHSYFEGDNLLRLLSVKIMSANEFSVGQRLVAIGAICYMLDNQALDGDIDSAQDMVILLGSNVDALSQFVSQIELPRASVGGQVNVFGTAWRSRDFRVGPTSVLQRAVMSDVMQIFIDEEGQEIVDTERSIERYVEGLVWLQKLYSRESHLMTNYLLNDFGRSKFPSIEQCDNHRFWNGYLRFLARYGVLRFMLASRASLYKEEFSLEHFADTVSVFSRFFEHNKKFAQRITGCFSAAKCDDYGKVMPLVVDYLF